MPQRDKYYPPCPVFLPSLEIAVPENRPFRPSAAQRVTALPRVVCPTTPIQLSRSGSAPTPLIDASGKRLIRFTAGVAHGPLISYL